MTTRAAAEPDKKIAYAIAHDDTGGSLFLFGKPNAAHVVLMSAGFPDDHGAFSPFARMLADSSKEFGDCLVGVTCLPGYDDRPQDKKPYQEHDPNGYSFNDMVASLREATKVLKSYSTNDKAKFTAIFHDWAVLPGLMFTNRALKEQQQQQATTTATAEHLSSLSFAPDQVVLFDVCLPPHPATVKDIPKPPKRSIFKVLYDGIVVFAYRVLLANCFCIRRYISSACAQFVLGTGFFILSTLQLSPTREIDDKTMMQKGSKKSADRLCYMSYPYWFLIKSILTGRILREVAGGSLPRNLLQTPVLYLYGTDKNIQFHPPLSISLLEHEHKQGGRSNAIAVADAGHWLYLQQQDVCFEHVCKFIQEQT